MKTLFRTAVCLLLLSCGGVRVNYDYDKKANFSAYQTYNYYAPDDTGLTALDSKRLFRLVDSVMTVKGLQLSDTPELLVDIKAEAYRTNNNSAVGVGVGGTGRNVGGGISVGIPVGSGLAREMVIGLVDQKRNALIWEAVSTTSYREGGTPNQREAQLRKVVLKIFEGFPPD